MDLDTGQPVGDLTFPADRPAHVNDAATQALSTGAPHSMAVDDGGGRLFVPYTLGLPDSHLPSLARGELCPRTATNSFSCVAGVHVVDAAKLEITASISLKPLGTEGGAVFGVHRALRYEPPSENESGSGKLLLLVEEAAADVAFLTTGATMPFAPRTNGLGSLYAVQIDLASARQEWSVRVDACRNTRDRYAGTEEEWHKRPNPAAIFRSMTVDDPALWVACHADNHQTGIVVRIPLDARGAPTDRAGAVPAVSLPDSSRPEGLEPAAVVPVDPRPVETYVGTERVSEFIADPASQRIAMRVVQFTPPAETWLVFDGQVRSFIGRIGTGSYTVDSGSAVLDHRTGRLYVFHPGDGGGFYVADMRRSPLPQALHFPQFDHLPLASAERTVWTPSIDSPPGDRATRLLFPVAADRYAVIEDNLPLSADVDRGTAGRTLDLEERPGITNTVVDGAARGYGVRALLLGGAEAVQRVPYLDAGGYAREAYEYAGRGGLTVNSLSGPLLETPPFPIMQDAGPCGDQDRELVLGFVGPDGPAVVDETGSRGSAIPVMIDGGTRSDGGAPVSRCAREDWDQVWGKALFGRAPAGEPASPWQGNERPAECVSGDGRAEDRVGDPVMDAFAAQTVCDGDQASGFGYARGLDTPAFRVGEALSSFRIYRDPARGIVSRVESVARGVALDGVLRIDTVRGVAESWANGRAQAVPGTDSDANCDYDRTAGTCFQPHLFGVWTPGYSCGPCGDEKAMVKGMQRAFGSWAQIRLRTPDPALARGSADGYIAGVQKADYERFGDLILNSDILQTTVPVLEIIRYAAPTRYSTTSQSLFARQPARGRQIYQFAGVEVSSSYSIQCLLVYDAEKNTCTAATESPGELKIQLTDPDGKPLAGGSFEVRQDVDGDGVRGLADTLTGTGPCVTADDGIGTCSFPALAPGKYVVSQGSAPPPYAPSTESFSVDLVSGESRTVVFTNVSGLSTVNVEVKTEDGKPLPGAAFAVYPDPDADGKVAPDAQPLDTCDTGDDGTCSMTVPTGSHVLVQTAAPNGLEPIEPVPFVIASGGQVASVQAVNYAPLAVSAPPPAASPGFTYQQPPAANPPTLHTVPLPTMGIPQDDPRTAPPADPGPGIGETIQRVVRAPGDALRLLARSPAEGVAFAAATLLFALACLAVDRRRKLLGLTA